MILQFSFLLLSSAEARVMNSNNYPILRRICSLGIQVVWTNERLCGGEHISVLSCLCKSSILSITAVSLS